MHRRYFLRAGTIAAGVLCLGNAGAGIAADGVRGAALAFVGRYSDRFLIRSELGGVTRVVAEVGDVSRMGEAFQRARRDGVGRLRVGGTLAAFEIRGRKFEVECLLPADFATYSA